jgi:hypothetical protein
MTIQNFNEINLGQQALPRSLTTPIIAIGAITAQNIGTLASVVIQDITYTAATGGTSGNSISVTYVESVLPGYETVEVSGSAITVNIGNSTISIVEVVDSTHLMVASTSGIQVGDTITQGLNSTIVSSIVSVSELQVVSTSGFVIGNATDTGLLSTATQVLTAIQNSYLASVLVTAIISGTPSNKQIGVSTTSLIGGSTSALVTNIHADSHANLTGPVQFVSGSGITLTQSGQAITVATNGSDLPALTNDQIWIGNGSNVATAQTVSGDATLSNTGVLTLSTVNGNVGSFTYSNITVNAKGLITAASSSTPVTSIAGTINQIIASSSTGSVTLSLPQSIATTSSPTFSNLTLSTPLTIGNGGTGTSTPSLIAGTNITITGTWPDQTINAVTQTTSPGGSSGDIQYNGSGSFVGAANITTDGSNLTLVNNNKLILGNNGNAWIKYNTSNGADEFTITTDGTNAFLGSPGTFELDANTNVDGSGTFLPNLVLGSGGGVGIAVVSGTGVQIAANSTGGTPVSALLQLVSTTQGFLPPVMTTTQRNAITTPVDGLIVYDTTLHKLWEFQNGTWVEVGGGTPGGSNTQVQYNNSGVFAGISNITTDGNNTLTLTGTFGNSTVISGANGLLISNSSNGSDASLNSNGVLSLGGNLANGTVATIGLSDEISGTTTSIYLDFGSIYGYSTTLTSNSVSNIFTVANASEIFAGAFITDSTQTLTTTVVSVNYNTNTVTVVNGTGWLNGDSITWTNDSLDFVENQSSTPGGSKVLSSLTQSGELIVLSQLYVAGSSVSAASYNAPIVNNIDPSSVLQADSTTQGFLPPRMITTQMNAIASPATGLMVFVTDSTPPSPFWYDGTTWRQVQHV